MSPPAWRLVSRSAKRIAPGPLLRRPFRLLFAGQVISQTGDVAFQVALAAYAISHHTPSLLAYTLLAQGIGTILMLLVSGALTDQLGSRRVLLGADATRCVAVAVIAFSAADAPGSRAWLIMLCGFVLGCGDGAFQPAFTVVFTELLPSSELLAANSLQTVGLRLCAVAGALFGGAMIAFTGSTAALGYDAATFAISVLCLLSAGRWATNRGPTAKLLSGLTAGIRYVASHRWLWVSIASFGLSVALVVSPSKVFLPIIVHDTLRAPPSTYGLLLAAQGAGALVGGWTVGRKKRIARPGVLIFGLMTGVGLSFALVAVSRSVALALVACAGVGAGVSAATIAWAALLQRRVPQALLGRVSSVDWIVSLGASPVALAAVPQLLQAHAAATILLASSAICVVTSLAVLFVRDVRTNQWHVDSVPDEERT